MKRIMKEYFTFSKKERIAVIILFCLIAAFLAAPYFLEKEKQKPIIDTALQEQLIKLQQNNTDSVSNNKVEIKNDSSSINKVDFFVFDPNTIDAEGWKKLGLNDRLIATILNYRNKGGKFRTAEDIRKIWGLKKEDADRLIPFVQIQSTTDNYNNYTNNYNYSKNKSSSQKKITTPIDINIATAEELMQLPGMNHSLPFRIINYREKLGSFVNLQQIKTAYGMTDSIYQLINPYLKIDLNTIKKININTASEYELSLNPNISRDIAKAIIIYRNQHGNYQKLEDLKKIVFINEEMFQKIVPYLTVDQ